MHVTSDVTPTRAELESSINSEHLDLHLLSSFSCDLKQLLQTDLVSSYVVTDIRSFTLVLYR